MKISKQQRETVFKKYDGKCAYCGCELQKGWHVDHIEPIVRDLAFSGGKVVSLPTCEKPENHTLNNFNPSCASCNIQKSSLTLEQFRRSIKQYVNSLNLYSTQYKIAKRYGLIQETNIEVKFYFETL